MKGDCDGLARGRDDVEAIFVIVVVAGPALGSDGPTFCSVSVSCEGMVYSTGWSIWSRSTFC